MPDLRQEIEHYYKKVVNLQTKNQKTIALQTMSKQDIQSIIHMWRTMMIDEKDDEFMHMATRLVKQILVVFQSNQSFHNLTTQQIDAFAKYISKIQFFQDIVNVIDILFLQKQIDTITKESSLFKALVQNFQRLQNDQVRGIAAQILAEMMKQNNSLMQYASNPYYFLQFFLQVINLEQEKQKIIYWMKIIQKLYLLQNSEKWLFNQNDFKILVDIIVRHIQNFDSQQSLVVYLEAYLTLSLLPFIMVKGSVYKLDLVMIVLNDTMTNNEAIKGYKQELGSLLNM